MSWTLRCCRLRTTGGGKIKVSDEKKSEVNAKLLEERNVGIFTSCLRLSQLADRLFSAQHAAQTNDILLVGECVRVIPTPCADRRRLEPTPSFEYPRRLRLNVHDCAASCSVTSYPAGSGGPFYTTIMWGQHVAMRRDPAGFLLTR